VRKRVREIQSSPEIEPGTPERDKLEQEKLSLSLQVGFHESQRLRLKYEENERGLTGIGSPLHQVIKLSWGAWIRHLLQKLKRRLVQSN
jgi:hypothetical protein